ncbi:MAG TPA: FHA domain-containing protein [Smithellaceae bacterium]|nr:FHA domain-containing protein [Smithellaceae bacterium]HQF85396.1 FHA domain-containing protein [Smithellaceae bacterium]HQG81631.1 FHA domain-containing protein [Smithellaceae bacterium]
MAKILLRFKGEIVDEIALDKDIISIGRKADNHVVIDNQAVSSHHAIIERQGDQLFIEDLKSLNGTFLNGRTVKRSEIFNGDVIVVGIHALEIQIDKDRFDEAKNAPGRGRSMFETIVITPEQRRRILLAASTTAPDVLGGFVVIRGAGGQKDYLIRDKVSNIGSEKGSVIRLRGLFAPRRAALVNRRKEGYFITPTSRKSIKVNGNVIEQRHDLKDGDIVDIGRLKLQFYIKEPGYGTDK